VVQELEEEKCKHEHDTAQGDDITYGLEKDRTRLKQVLRLCREESDIKSLPVAFAIFHLRVFRALQELNLERLAKKKLEKDLKKATDTAEEEKEKQKHIVLLLLADRKQAIMKYIEERKRSEDLAQVINLFKGFFLIYSQLIQLF